MALKAFNGVVLLIVVVFGIEAAYADESKEAEWKQLIEADSAWKEWEGGNYPMCKQRDTSEFCKYLVGSGILLNMGSKITSKQAGTEFVNYVGSLMDGKGGQNFTSTTTEVPPKPAPSTTKPTSVPDEPEGEPLTTTTPTVSTRDPPQTEITTPATVFNNTNKTTPVGSTPEPASGPSVDPLTWSLPLVAVLLVAMGVAGIFIHRYVKKAGYLQSRKSDEPAKGGSEGV